MDSRRRDYGRYGQVACRYFSAATGLLPTHKKSDGQERISCLPSVCQFQMFRIRLVVLLRCISSMIRSFEPSQRTYLRFASLVVACLILPVISAAQTTTITGQIKDLSGTLITSGQVAFTLQPGIDTSMSGVARFSSSEIDCLINGSGLVKALDGTSACTLTQNTAITSPSGTSYKGCIQPGFIQPGSCFVFYAIGSTLDITTTPATPSLTPAYSLVDTFSNQTIGGVKTFSNAIGAPNLAGTGSCSNSFVTVINSGGSTPTCGATANNVIANQGTNGTDALSGSRATDSSPSGNFINFKSFAGTTLFKVDILGNIVATGITATSANITSFNTTSIFQSAATLFTIFDNQSGIRFQIPSNGSGRGVINNMAIGGGSTYGGTTQNVQKFTSSGTFTIPANVTSVKVTVVGAGGAGAGSTASNSGGGGGSGGNTIKYLTGLTSGNTLTVTVGSGGVGVSGAGGNTGGNSTVASGTQTITSIIANGGSGGSIAAGVGVGGGGGAAGSGGDENNAGTPGALGIASISIGGGGAPSVRGGGGQATGNASGNTGTSPGSGGGGSGAGGTNTGGTGATGLVVFEWTT